ncbi:MAG: 30S ribosome-binding factor RbfA [Chloroflexi bacterium]|nr:30S ribosome-binding factor RbfA [Chloroflexota bacterium]
MSRRMEKVADLLQSEIAELLERRIKHPAIERAMVSITHVDVAPDLSNARIHVSVMADAEEQAEVLDALGRSASFLHRELTKRIRIRRVPFLRFELDHSIAEADRLTKLMHEVARGEGRDAEQEAEQETQRETQRETRYRAQYETAYEARTEAGAKPPSPARGEPLPEPAAE